MSGSLNGDKLIDFDLATLNGDLPEVTLTLREPYVMMYSLSRTSDGAEVMLDWDRNNPNSNLRITSRFTDSSDSSSTQHDLDIKVSRTNLFSFVVLVAVVIGGGGGRRRVIQFTL